MHVRTLIALCLLVPLPLLGEGIQEWAKRMEARHIRASVGV
jgi:hypothetical protein